MNIMSVVYSICALLGLLIIVVATTPPDHR
jgi:hypothetical protein